MNDRQLGNLANLTGTVTAAICLTVSLDHIEAHGYLWLALYSFGVAVLALKLNRVFRSGE